MDTRSLKIDSVNNNFKFSKGWLCGFIQSDGCFSVTFEKRKSGLFVRPKPIFVLTQDISEENLFRSLQNHFGIGFIVTNKTNVSWYITSLAELNDILFPILEEYPLKYGKLKAYLIFKHIVSEMLAKKHLSLKGLLDIVSLGFELNSETTRRTEDSKINLIKFLEEKHGVLPESSVNVLDFEYRSNQKSPLSLDFIAGLIDGDGSFNVSFKIEPNTRIKPNFTVVQETSCAELLNDLVTYFSCGKVYKLPSAASRYQVENVNLVLNNIKPILDGVKLNTYKGDMYKMTKKVCEILKEKNSFPRGTLGKASFPLGKSNKTLKEIVELVYDSNKSGKRRKISKEEFIEKIDKIYPLDK